MLSWSALASAAPVAVRVEQTKDGWQLVRDGKPYFIRGAGGKASLEELVAAGGNSVRTWGADDLEALLDEAHALGLTVTVGIWLGHERHGFDYGDAKQVQEQLERARQTVLRYKDHPAVLIWGIGNEMEGYGGGDDPRIWKAVNDIATVVKKVDPNHPTMTVTAEIGGARVKAVREYCPAIDIHGINSYGGASSLVERYRAAGGTKPFVLTEFGPPGAWEVGKNDWGAPAEPTSTQKADAYRRHYEAAVTRSGGWALGSYAFAWGSKVEGTTTWHGMFLPDGARLAAVDTMTKIWSGRAPANLAPTIQPLEVEGSVRNDPGDVVRVRASIADPEGGALRAKWALLRETGEYSTGGDYRRTPTVMEGAVVESDVRGARVRMPQYPGPYRLYVTAYDDARGAATANIALMVNGDRRNPMPFDVYTDGFEGMPWTPSGWMGNTELAKLDGAHRDNPHGGDRCIKLRFTGGYGTWLSIAWQHPLDDWGEKPGGYDLRGATHLEFWARGEFGIETIDVGVGILGKDKPYPDSAKVSEKGIRLGKEWKRYQIRLKKVDLSRIKTGFVVTTGGRNADTIVYLDDIRFIRK